ncbi:MAG: hypothetical protein KC593_00340 [Myxococcales bacterium]|nr:hypothetical protein [Myxococcales bacterium]
MSYRDELEAAHARIEALEQQLASAQPARESAAARALTEELEILRQTLAAERSLAKHSQASHDAQLQAEREVAAAQVAKAEAVLDATKGALELRLQYAVREREEAERRLEELAALSRETALRLYEGQRAAAVAERERLLAEVAGALGARPAESASMEEQIRYENALHAAKRTESMSAMLDERIARLTRLCALLEQPPRA